MYSVFVDDRKVPEATFRVKDQAETFGMGSFPGRYVVRPTVEQDMTDNTLLRAEVDRLTKQVAELEASVLEEMKNRDEAIEDADRLAHDLTDNTLLRAEVDRLTKQVAELEASVLEEMKNRDEAIEDADRLAHAIGTEEEIGEHTNLNCPYDNAIELLTAQRAAAGVLSHIPHECEVCGTDVRLWICPTCGEGMVDEAEGSRDVPRIILTEREAVLQIVIDWFRESEDLDELRRRLQCKDFDADAAAGRDASEKAIADVIRAARTVQDFLWGPTDGSWGLAGWVGMFEKRARKLADINRDNPHAAVELRKRLLQIGALAVKFMAFVEKNGVPWEATVPAEELAKSPAVAMSSHPDLSTGPRRRCETCGSFDSPQCGFGVGAGESCDAWTKADPVPTR